MGYNRENFRRIRREYEGKNLKAKEEAERRAAMLWERIPDLREIDDALSQTGMKIFAAASKYSGEELEQVIESLKQETKLLRTTREALLQAYGYPADYTDPQYECDICKDTGAYRMKMCKCMREKLVLAGYASSGIAKLMETQSFESFKPSLQRDSASFAGILNCSKQYADNFDGKSGRGLVLMGGTGLGKTHISTAIAKTVIENGFDVVYETAANLFADYETERFASRHFEEDETRSTARYTECDLLIIDDLGSEMSNQFTVSVLYNLLNTRINKGASTVISTNLGPDELRRRYTDRITSRLLGTCTVLVFQGEDIRMKKIKQMQ